jgi:hypothetical protein
MKFLVKILFISLVFLPSIVSAECQEYPPGSGNWYPGKFSNQSLKLSDVQDCIDSAKGENDYRNGDTVHLKKGSVTWDGNLTINKGISLLGAGSATKPQTIINRKDKIIEITTNQGVRISGINFRTTAKLGGNTAMIRISNAIGSATGSAGFRIDNNYFQADASSGDDFSRAIWFYASTTKGQPKGVIDNNILKRCRILVSSSSYHHRNRYWANDYWFGTEKTIFIEDNDFDNTPGSRSNTAKTSIDGDMSGPGYVARYNKMTNAYILIHQSKQLTSDNNKYISRAPRGWEIYGNTLDQDATYKQYARPIYLRGGTGFCFDNKVNNSNPFGAFQIGMNLEGARTGNCNGSDKYRDGNQVTSGKGAGWPCRDQIGRGKDAFFWETFSNPPKQESKPAYLWNNNVKVVVNTEIDKYYIAQNRDYYEDNNSHLKSGTWDARPAACQNGDGYWATDKGSGWNKSNDKSHDGALYVCRANTWNHYYEPYTYPHPLRSDFKGGTNKESNPPGTPGEAWISD